MINDDFSSVMQSDEFASEYEAWLDDVYCVKSSPNHDWDTIHVEDEE